MEKEKQRSTSPATSGPLTKREEFAKAAMMGILTNEAGTIFQKESQCATIARKAVFMADALLAELEKPIPSI